MTKPKISLQPSEGIVARMAATIYAAYITAGRVTDGHEKDWMDRAIKEALRIARIVDENVQSDGEMG